MYLLIILHKYTKNFHKAYYLKISHNSQQNNPYLQQNHPFAK